MMVSVRGTAGRAAILAAPIFVLGSVGTVAAAGETARLVRSNGEGALLEVDAPWPEAPADAGAGRWTLPGDPERWTRIGETGKPDLPMGTFDLALPPGMRPVVTSRVIRSRLLPGAAPRPVPRYAIRTNANGLPSQEEIEVRDDAAYRSEYPEIWAEAGEIGTLRHLRVFSVRVFPYHWDAIAGALRYAEKLEVEVRFVPDPALPADLRERSAAPGPEDASWERLYRNTILNADQALSWRRTPASWRATALRREGKALLDAPEYRIQIRRSDFQRVTQDALVAAGWDAGSVPLDRLALVERFFEESDPDDPFREQPVPIHVRDVDGDGSFGPGDDFLFFGLNAWDRFHPLPRDKRYGRTHAYYLSLREEGGARFATAPSTLDAADLPVNDSAVWTQHFEETGHYMVPGVSGVLSPDQPSDFQGAVESIRNEHFYWLGGSGGGEFSTRFELPGYREALGFRILFQRTSIPEDSPTAVVTVSVGALPGGLVDIIGPFTITSCETVLRVLGRDELRNVPLAARNNSLKMTIPYEYYSSAIDWFEWTWRRDLAAVNRRVAFSTAGLAGRQEFRLLNFGVADTTGADRLLLFDLSDSARTESRPGPILLTWRPDQYQGTVLRLQLDLGAQGTPRPIVALAPAAASQPAPGDLARIDPADPIYQGHHDLTQAPGADEDLLCIVHRDFAAGIEPLLAARRAQGLVVRKALADQVYDQFNGGRASPVAIRNYLRYLFRTRASSPSYLLLVGDASDDFQGALPESDPNFVPTQTVFSEASSGQGPELVGCDYWYVDRLSEPGERFDFRPDMHVGRLPVGTPEELENLVRKIVNYGQFSDADTWRARGLLVADDEFSSTISFTEVYRYNGDKNNVVRQNGESRFRWTAWQARRIIREEAGFEEFACDSFFTADYMDTVAANWEYNGHPVDMRRCVAKDGPCPTWRCRADGFPYPDSMYACMNDVSAPYFTQTPYVWWESNQWYGRMKVNPQFRAALSRGHLFVNYQGHANARLLSHEHILIANPNTQVDPPFLQNEDKPFFFLGFGCHLGEFSAGDEGSSGRGDSMGERMLFLDKGRGALAVLGSSGYEWIHVTEVLDLAIFRAWFKNPPLGPEGQPRWILGEILTQAKTSVASGTGRNQTPTYQFLGDPSMPVEMAPPRLQVFLNCRPGETGCDPWEEGALRAEAGSDTVRIRALLVEETGIRGVSVRDAAGVVDPAAYRIVEDPARPGDLKRRVLEYDRALDVPVEDYEISIEVEDGNARRREVRLPVELAAAFFVVQAGEQRPIRADDVLATGDSLLITADLPVDAAPEHVDLWLDSTPLLTSLDPGSDLRRHRLRSVLPELPEGEHLLRLRIDREAGTPAERTAAFLGPLSGGTRLLQLYNFPNPFEDRTEITYRLSGDARSARLSIFTLSGRKIWSAEVPAEANDHVVVWDGRDADGDEVANGVYLYKLEIRTHEGRTLERVERIARIR